MFTFFEVKFRKNWNFNNFFGEVKIRKNSIFNFFSGVKIREKTEV